jgi:hypothetical protein
MNFRKLTQIWSYQFLSSLRRKRTWVFLLLLPILFALLPVLRTTLFSSTDDHRSYETELIAVVDSDGLLRDSLSKCVEGEVAEGATVEVPLEIKWKDENPKPAALPKLICVKNLQAALALLKESQVTAVVDVSQTNGGPYRYYSHSVSLLERQVRASYRVAREVQLKLEGVEPTLSKKLLDTLQFERFKLNQDGSVTSIEPEGDSAYGSLLCSFMGLVFILFYFLFGMLVPGRCRINRFAELALSSLSTTEYVTYQSVSMVGLVFLRMLAVSIVYSSTTVLLQNLYAGAPSVCPAFGFSYKFPIVLCAMALSSQVAACAGIFLAGFLPSILRALLLVLCWIVVALGPDILDIPARLEWLIYVPLLSGPMLLGIATRGALTIRDVVPIFPLIVAAIVTTFLAAKSLRLNLALVDQPLRMSRIIRVLKSWV